jgi:hypothetical protein
MARDEELVAGIEPFQVLPRGHAAGLSVNAAITVSAGQNEIPDPIQLQANIQFQERPWKKVIHIRQTFRSPLYGDVTKAVEALSLLVSV